MLNALYLHYNISRVVLSYLRHQTPNAPILTIREERFKPRFNGIHQYAGSLQTALKKESTSDSRQAMPHRGGTLSACNPFSGLLRSLHENVPIGDGTHPPDPFMV